MSDPEPTTALIVPAPMPATKMTSACCQLTDTASSVGTVPAVA